MTPLETKLQALAETFAQLVKPPVTVLEIFDTVNAIGVVVQEVEPAATEAEYEAALLQGWRWADKTFAIVEKADEAIKFPIWLVAAEAFDGPGIRYLAERVLIPALAKKLASAIG